MARRRSCARLRASKPSGRGRTHRDPVWTGSHGPTDAAKRPITRHPARAADPEARRRCAPDPEGRRRIGRRRDVLGGLLTRSGRIGRLPRGTGLLDQGRFRHDSQCNQRRRQAVVRPGADAAAPTRDDRHGQVVRPQHEPVEPGSAVGHDGVEPRLAGRRVEQLADQRDRVRPAGETHRRARRRRRAISSSRWRPTSPTALRRRRRAGRCWPRAPTEPRRPAARPPPPGSISTSS